MKDSDHDLQGRDPALYYDLRKRHYQDDSIAGKYDERRFGSSKRAQRSVAKWRAIQAALRHAGDVRTILDMPTGTGRFVNQYLAAGYELVGADISGEMMSVAQAKIPADADGARGFVQTDGEALAFRTGAFDCIVLIRFLFHLTHEARISVLRECARVSGRWVIADYRHRYSLRYAKQVAAHRLGLRGPAEPRVTRAEMLDEIGQAGLRMVKIFSIAPLFSDKWIVLCETR